MAATIPCRKVFKFRMEPTGLEALELGLQLGQERQERGTKNHRRGIPETLNACGLRVRESGGSQHRRLKQESSAFRQGSVKNATVRDEVARRLKDASAEVAVCDFLSASLNFPVTSPVPMVLFQHNVETMLWRRMAATEKSPFRKLSYRIEAGKMAVR